MPHGYADYGGRSPKNIIHAIYDLGELAVRLKGLSSIDRLGDVLYIEDFSNGLGGSYQIGSGTGYYQILSGGNFYSSGWSVRMVAGSDNQRNAQCRTVIPYPEVTKLGFEFRYQPRSDLQYIYFIGIVVQGTTYHTAYFRVSIANRTLQLQDENSVFHTIESAFAVYYKDVGFYALKFVIDMNTWKYVRVQADYELYDISSYSLYSGTTTAEGVVYADFYAVSNLGSNGVCYLDSVILTQNEP